LPITWAAVSDTGKVRQENQDIYLADPKVGLFLVSDGMGGHQCGSLASRIVARTLPLLVDNKLKQLKTRGMRAMKSMLTKAIIELSGQMRTESMNVLGVMDMGATLVLALLCENRAFIANVGDSRAYLFRNGKLSQISEDHSAIAQLLRTGEITPRETRNHPARGQLSRYIGMSDEVNPFLHTITLKENDRFLLCTDGLTDVVRDNEIEAILQDHADSQNACKALVETAILFGGPDNITALIVDRH
jgi:serine/threonine protein phosphatase PrpC